MISYVAEAQGDELSLQALGVPVTSESYSRREKRKARRSKGTLSCSPALGKSVQLIQIGKIRNVD